MANNKKWIALVMAVILVGTMLSGVAMAEKDVITINVWGGTPEEGGPGAIVEAYNALNTGIQIVYTRYVNDESGNTKLDTALLSGADIDIFTSHGPDRFSNRLTSGMCEDLTPYLTEAGIDVERDFGVSYARMDGKDYAIPVTDAADFIWLNKDMVEAAGLTVPTEWTFEEYRNYAKALTNGDGENKVFGSIVQVAWPNMWMKPAQVALGGDSASDKYVFDLENEYFTKSLQWRYDMEVIDQSQVPVTLQKTSKIAMQDMFFPGKAAMMYGGSWLIRYAKNTTDYPHDFVSAFAPLPRWDDQSGYFNSAGSVDEYMAINPKSAKKDAAFEVLKYWATEGYYPACAFGKIPAWKNADPDKVLALVLGENADELFDVETVKRVLFDDFNYFTTPMVPCRSEVAVALEREADKCLSGEQSVEEAIENMKTAAESIVSMQ